MNEFEENKYIEIKENLISNEVEKKVTNYFINRNEVERYFNVGRLIIEAQGGEERAKYGDGLIRKYSERLMIEINKKYSYRNLMYMRKFYLLFRNENVNTMCSYLSWSHYRQLLILEDINEINYYINIIINKNLSVRALQEHIKNKEYQRLLTETKNKLITKEKNKIDDFIKNPIIINTYGNSNNYIDILLFNYLYNCYVVVELKVTESKKDHLGQIQVYMNYIDKHIRSINQNKTIGIIVCRKDNKYLIEYSSDNRIKITTYELV